MGWVEGHAGARAAPAVTRDLDLCMRFTPVCQRVRTALHQGDAASGQVQGAVGERRSAAMAALVRCAPAQPQARRQQLRARTARRQRAAACAGSQGMPPQLAKALRCRYVYLHEIGADPVRSARACARAHAHVCVRERARVHMYVSVCKDACEYAEMSAGGVQDGRADAAIAAPDPHPTRARARITAPTLGLQSYRDASRADASRERPRHRARRARTERPVDLAASGSPRGVRGGSGGRRERAAQDNRLRRGCVRGRTLRGAPPGRGRQDLPAEPRVQAAQGARCARWWRRRRGCVGARRREDARGRGWGFTV